MIIRLPRRHGSILSDVSLELTATPDLRKKKKYVNPHNYYHRNKLKIYRLPNPSTKGRPKEWLATPLLHWYPSQYANFTFVDNLSTLEILSLIPEEFNPSVWRKSGSPYKILSVPKDRRKETFDLLNVMGYRYHSTDRKWIKRVRSVNGFKAHFRTKLSRQVCNFGLKKRVFSLKSIKTI